MPGLNDVDLVAAVRPLLAGPDLAGLGVHGKTELVAVAHREDLGLVARATDERIVRRHGAVVAKPQQLAAVVAGILRRRVGALLRAAEAHVDHAVAAEDDARGLGRDVSREQIADVG